MNSYLVYGGHLRSELEFPSLTPGRADGADWTVWVGESDPPRWSKQLRGAREVAPGWTMRLYDMGAAGCRLEFGPAGTFDIGPRLGTHGSQIVWYPGTGAPAWFIRSTILGPVLALTLHDAGVLCLHGSAVAMDGEAIAFVAPKFHGKSTLAASLVSHGARLVTDDVVAIEPGSFPIVRPGVHSIRLLEDSAKLMATRVPGVIEPGPKMTVRRLPERLLARRPVPLGTIYVLEPDEPRGARIAVERKPLRPVVAAAQVALRTTLRDRLVGSDIAATKLRWIAEVVQRVPVYQLRVARDLDRLVEVGDRLLDWHKVTERPGVPA